MRFCRLAVGGCGRRFFDPVRRRRPRSESLWTNMFRTTDFGVYDTIKDAGNVSEPRPVPSNVWAPPYAKAGRVTDEPEQDAPPEVHADGRIGLLRQSCKLAKFVLDSAGTVARPGATTDDIDRFAHDLIVGNNAYPSPLNYKGFRKSVCTSVNNVVCHGVPDDRPLLDGDLVSVDVSVYFNGVHGDCCATYCVGRVDEPGASLMAVARQCMHEGIEACGPGKRFADIGVAIESYARKNFHSVASSITGHGIGTYFHGPPTIFHTSMYHYPGVMKPGMVFTIEPVICQGDGEIAMLDDGWTIVTNDDSRGAQFEHTILITDSGYDILTK